MFLLVYNSKKEPNFCLPTNPFMLIPKLMKKKIMPSLIRMT